MENNLKRNRCLHIPESLHCTPKTLQINVFDLLRGKKGDPNSCVVTMTKDYNSQEVCLAIKTKDQEGGKKER